MTTTDKELLELAAKAAGIEIQDERIWVDAKETMGGSWEKWNPLTDDGDALRLAVKLRMVIDCVLGAEYVEYFLNGHIQYINIDITDDPYAATRRAIVRAAASIGEKL